MQNEIIQSVSSIATENAGGFPWGLLFSALAAAGAILSALVYCIWSKRLVAVQRDMNAWQTQQRCPELLLVQAYMERHVDNTRVKFYAAHAGASSPSTGFLVTVQLNNPGDVPIHVLRTQLVLEGEMFIGTRNRAFRTGSKYGLIPPHSLMDFFLFAADAEARNLDEWPSIKFLIEYVSGSEARELDLHFAAPDAGPMTGRIPLLPSDSS